jgi:hypothetical protein
MKTLLTVLILAAFLRTTVAASPASRGKTIADINVIPTRVLQRAISPKFFKTLLISPIQSRVVVRGELSGTRLAGLRVVHSESNAQWDALALQRASEVRMAGMTRSTGQIRRAPFWFTF